MPGLSRFEADARDVHVRGARQQWRRRRGGRIRDGQFRHVEWRRIHRRRMLWRRLRLPLTQEPNPRPLPEREGEQKISNSVPTSRAGAQNFDLVPLPVRGAEFSIWFPFPRGGTNFDLIPFPAREGEQKIYLVPLP